ncbi:16S rRNA (uracil(1498)-N(3))-methyltransferase [Gammaproteobacteria bacterium]|nr:16S rRNA (uracil(1498)-N(3))-methyltransferase [Gammaproteobacteria bacterium]MDA8864746.1 16S rRNA (uracil(1498)-N(3))-methyltransferase [Gammaproteobacteria bacterium]MDA8899454.1 16S rRNA (uracil(1498)-N(3))-methyltransferase [Gammaproteobacteria bacterium]MDA8998084.1 16S rRNA (uracil(1498)-N(3))-methyltransferase [Gammaproteobacteria bacterium]MDA8999033.1 16S rRNA (uracil(1498)-N(3))-methyltransferase [Gammaproteobacteria bacterium]
MRIHRIYCNSVSDQDNVFDLDQPQSTHISKVLRLKLGNEIDVFDGKGSSAICKIVEITRSSIVLERISELKKLNPTHPKINAILPIIKKDNLHFMLQKLTEVGVYEFIFYKPDLVDQSIAKKDSEKIMNKCNEVIINACKQCGSNFIPAIYYFSNLELAVNSVKGIAIESYAFDLDAKEHFNLAEIKTGEDVCMITGPESGFSKEEIEILSKKDTKIRLLKNNVLRAETAPIVISSLLQNHFGNI